MFLSYFLSKKKKREKNRIKDDKNRRQSSKVSQKSSREIWKGEKTYYRNKSHTTSSRIGLARASCNNRKWYGNVYKAIQEGKRDQRLLLLNLSCKYRSQNHFHIFNHLGNISNMYILGEG